ncbi:MAG: AIR synthase family protein [Methylococcales bacterium]|nr:AIR synthase family protein [Methylococcales bacterium]
MTIARTRLPAGKLPAARLEALLAACRVPRGSGVVVGPRFGEDAAVIDVGPKYLVAKTDPITFTAEHIGWYAVNINANDIATLGARPRWFLATLLLPEKKSTARLAESIFAEILEACRALGVALCGGHTEITVGLDRPIVVGLMLGEVEKEKLVRKETQRPGDLVILTKGIALEGTAILAREKAAVLKRRFGAAVVRRAQRLLFDPGISVVREARLAVRAGEVHAMHDPTEGGLLSGVYELARAGDVGIRIWKDKVPILPETELFSRYFGFDPFALIASGSLLLTVSARSTAKVLQSLAKKGVHATIIGEILPRNKGLWALEGSRLRRLHPPRRDEIARLLA